MPDEIKLVLFDMDNVLCEYDRGRRVAFLAELAGTTSEFVYKAIWESGFELLGDSGTLDAADYLRGFGERIGYPLSLDEWVEARRRSMKADRAVLEIARRLHETIDVAVLTNNTTLVADHIDALLPELRPLFGSRIYTSARFKAAKPDPRCYQPVGATDDAADRSVRRRPRRKCRRRAGSGPLRASSHVGGGFPAGPFGARPAPGRMNGRTVSRDVRRDDTPQNGRPPLPSVRARFPRSAAGRSGSGCGSGSRMAASSGLARRP